MKIQFKYHLFTNPNRTKTKTFNITDDKSILEMILWVSATSFLPDHPVLRHINEVIVNKHTFKTDDYSNPGCWIDGIKEALKGVNND